MFIFLLEWVYICWDMCYDRYICVIDDEFMEFKCLIFKGIIFCVIGIDVEKRKEIKYFVIFYGGIYLGELNMNICIYFLVEIFCGEKYEYVRKWNFYCVFIQWFFDLVEDGFCFDELFYYILLDEDNCFIAGRRFLGKFVKGIIVFFKSSVVKKSFNKVVEVVLKSVQRYGNEDFMLIFGNKKLFLNQFKRFNNVFRLVEIYLGDVESLDFDV